MKKILVIDDDGPVRAGLVTALRRRGYVVQAASHGAEGLELAFRDQPDLVLCDVNMPGQNGFDVLKELRARPETTAVPVILMTGEPHRADARHSMNQGADDYLLKPFTMDQMLEAVSGRLERQDGIHRALAARTAAERLSAAEKIRLQTTALEAVANSIVITDPQGKILWVNQSFTRLTGYAAEEVIGKNPRIWNSGRQPPKFFADMWAAINAGQVWHGELVNKRKGGGYYHEEMTITPVRDVNGAVRNFVAVKQDVTERKHSELALAHKSDLLLALMDNLPDHIYFKDVQSRYTRVNRAMATHLGLAQPDDAIGKTDADFFPPREARQKLVDERCLLASGKPILGLVERSDAAQKTCWVSSTKVPIHGRDGEIAGLVGISRDITEMKQAEEDLRQSEEKFRQLAANVSDVFWISSADHQQILYVSPAYEMIWGRSMKSLYELPHQWFEAILPEERVRVFNLFTSLRENATDVSTEYRITRPDGSVRWVHDRGFQVRDAAGKVVRLAGIASDITERRRLETELFQARKLESIGQLAAGIAHEINTPIQYVGDNVRFMKDSFAAVATVLDAQAEVLAAARSGSVTPELLARNDAMLAASDLGYFRDQIPQALAETLEGVERVAKIIRAMKEFSHPGGKEKAPANLNKAIESTVTVARNEWKYVADMKLELDDRLPYVDCFLGEFNQAVLNLIVNAAHAIGDVVSLNPGAKGLITVQTRGEGDFAEVRVTDTGTGIPEAVRPKIFDPFFTTKDVGKGTGQGLAIVYGAVVNRLGGSVTYETEVGRGTTFILRLPVKSRTKTEAGVPSPAAAIA